MTCACPSISISWVREGDKKETINHFVEKLCSFFIAWPDSGRDGAPYFYDRWSSDPNNDPDEIAENDISAANRLAARTSWKYWSESAKVLSRILVDLPPNEDLFDPDVWADRRATVEAFYDKAMSTRGIGYAGASKVLHLKRPQLIPICDSVIVKFLFCGDSLSKLSDLKVAMKCTDEVQRIGLENRDALAKAQTYLTRLPPDDAYSNLTRVRILDMVLWSTNSFEKYWKLLGWD
jgi:hypothetical protein